MRIRVQLGFLLRDSVVYGLAGALNRMVKLVLVPIVAKTQTTEVYGVFDSLNVYVYVAAILAILGLNSAVVIVATADGSVPSAESLRPAASRCFRIVLGVGIGLALLICLGASFWSSWLLGSARFTSVVRWAGASVPFSAVLLYSLGMLQWTYRKFWYVTVALLTASTTIALTYAAARLGHGLTGFFVAHLVGQAVGAFLGLYAARQVIRPTRVSTDLRRLLTVGLPFGVIGVAATLVPSIDRLFLVRFHSLTEAGIYGLGQKIASLSVLMLAGFQAAWAPFAFARRSDPQKERLFGTILLVVASAVALLAVLLAIAAPTIARIAATDEFVASTTYVGPLALSVGLTVIFAVVSIGSVMEGRSLHNLTAYVLGLAITLAANLVLAAVSAPAIGIAWANCLGQLSAVVVMAVLAHKAHPIAYPYGKVGIVLLGGVAAVAAIGTHVLQMSPLGRVLAALGAAVVAVTWCWLSALSAGERALVLRRLYARPAK